MLEFTKYCHETYMVPIWEGDTVYNETVMFVAEKEAPLLYYPEKIVSVRSYELKKEFIENEDYYIENGKICLTENTRIPSFSLEEYYPKEHIEGKSFGCTLDGHEYIFFSEGSTIFKKQIHVTYIHKDKWNGFIPLAQNKFSRFTEKAKRGEELTVLFYGDSITVGANSSKFVGCEPYADTWFDMVVESMKKHFKNDKIKCVNTAVGGKNTSWAIDNLQERAINVNPDLMIVGFGMNDYSLDPKQYKEKTKELIDNFRIARPDTDIAVISTMLPHFRVSGFFQKQYLFEDALNELFKEYPNVGVVPVTSMHKSLLEKKRYYDMTGNNVNHPNDFMARVYAQTILKTILDI